FGCALLPGLCQPAAVLVPSSLFVCLLFLDLSPPLAPLFPYTTLFRSARWPWTRCTSTRTPTSPSTTARSREAGPSTARCRCPRRSEEHTSELQSRFDLVCRPPLGQNNHAGRGRGARAPRARPRCKGTH